MFASCPIATVPVLRYMQQSKLFATIHPSAISPELRHMQESKPFANGAMRQCFAMKKQSTFSAFRTWAVAGNFVAKQYMKPVDADTYVQDVVLQMDAKRLGEAYNRCVPYTTKGCDHKTPMHTSSEVFEHRCNHCSQLQSDVCAHRCVVTGQGGTVAAWCPR